MEVIPSRSLQGMSLFINAEIKSTHISKMGLSPQCVDKASQYYYRDVLLHVKLNAYFVVYCLEIGSDKIFWRTNHWRR